MSNGTDPSLEEEQLHPRSHRLIRHLALVYVCGALVVVLFLCCALLPHSFVPRIGAMARECVTGGLGAMVLPALLVTLTALAGTLALTRARFRFSLLEAEAQSASGGRRLERGDDPGYAGRQGQALIMTVGAVGVWIAIRFMWPKAASAHHAAHADIVAAFVFGLAFVSLVCERVLNAFPAPQLPEAPTLRRLLLLTTLIMVAGACIEIGRGAALAWLRWPELVIICICGVTAAELATRALARMFLPARVPLEARAVSDSLLAALVTGGPRAPGNVLRTQFGLDFARSWALSFLSAAMLPALFGTALLCWGLSGVKLVDLHHRGIYERLGAPVAVLHPGLHLILPWPLGRLRLVEFGAVHAVPIGVGESKSMFVETRKPIGAEAVPPVSLNRLWVTAHADQAHYLVPSKGAGEQSFQSVATEIYVLYRVGLTNTDALESVYTVADPEALIKADASRLVLRYFNSRTLEQVIGAQRENVAGMLRTQLQSDPDIRGTGIDIVKVLIEEIHPPAGAAAAYHEVQAARINASASIANERGRAKRTAGVAAEEAHELETVAVARASETIHAADAAAYRFGADHRSYDEGRHSFLFERRLTTLEAALAHSHITLVDDRLKPDQLPILDLRAFAPAPSGSGAGASEGGSGSASAAGLGSGTGTRTGTEMPPLTPPIIPPSD